VFAFGDELGEFPEGLDESGVVSDAGEVHGGFELGGFGRGEVSDGSANIELYSVEAGLVAVDGLCEFGVGSDFGSPVGAHGFDGVGRGLGEFDLTSGLEIDQALGLILGKAEFFEYWEGSFDGLRVEGVVLGSLECGIGIGGLAGFGGLGFDRFAIFVEGGLDGLVS